MLHNTPNIVRFHYVVHVFSIYLSVPIVWQIVRYIIINFHLITICTYNIFLVICTVYLLIHFFSHVLYFILRFFISCLEGRFPSFLPYPLFLVLSVCLVFILFRIWVLRLITQLVIVWSNFFAELVYNVCCVFIKKFIFPSVSKCHFPIFTHTHTDVYNV